MILYKQNIKLSQRQLTKMPEESYFVLNTSTGNTSKCLYMKFNVFQNPILEIIVTVKITTSKNFKFRLYKINIIRYDSIR